MTCMLALNQMGALHSLTSSGTTYASQHCAVPYVNVKSIELP